jgi:hypothetical protein
MKQGDFALALRRYAPRASGKIGGFVIVTTIYSTMNSIANAPISQEQLLDLLALLAAKLDAIVSNGLILSENADDYEAEKIRLKISQKQGEIARLRQQMAKVKNYITRRKRLEKQRHGKLSS